MGLSEETKQKIRDSSNKRPVYQFDKITNEFICSFDSCVDAAKGIGMDKHKGAHNISTCAKKNEITAYGYRWSYHFYNIAKQELISFVKYSLAHPLFSEEEVNYNEIYNDWKFKTQFYHKPKTILQIAFIVARYFDYSIDDLHTISRKAETLFPKQVACYFMKKHGHTYTQIGEYWGFASHCNARSSAIRVNNDIDTDKYKASQIREIKNLLF